MSDGQAIELGNLLRVNGYPQSLDRSKFEIHVSDMRAFSDCRQRWFWSSPLGMHLEPNTPNTFFFLGHVVHDALELFYTGKADTLEDAVRTSKAANMEIVQSQQKGTAWSHEVAALAKEMVLAEDMLYNYGLWIAERDYEGAPFSDSNLEFISMEQTWEIPAITPGGRGSPRVYFAGRFDGLVRRKDTGELWLFETKTSANPKGLIRSLQNDNQATMYVMAAREIMDEPVMGILYNIILKKSPKMPAVLKNGLLSQAKGQQCSPELYREAIRQVHPQYSPADVNRMYGQILQVLEDKAPYVQRLFIKRSEAHVDLFREEAHAQALEMVNPKTKVYPAPSAIKCGWCKFWEPCTARYRGEDATPYLEMDYRKRDMWQSVGEVEQSRGVMG